MTSKQGGIVLEMVQFTKPGRISQYVELYSEKAGQLLRKDGWKEMSNPTFFEEIQ